MLGIPVRYILKHPISALADLAADPRQVWATVLDTCVDLRERRRPECEYVADEYWQRQLHDSLGVSWPCGLTSEFWDLWSEVMEELKRKGFGPARRVSRLGMTATPGLCGRSGVWFVTWRQR